MKYLFITISIIVLSFFSTNASAFGGPDDGGEDTVKAVVSYGNEYLFESARDFKRESLSAMIDSLLEMDTVNAHLLREIKIYQEVLFKSETEILSMIDSLFELSEIPYALINEVNLFISNMEDDQPLVRSSFLIPSQDGIYPAIEYYNEEWNTRVPFNYSSELTSNDSSSVVLLRDEKRGWNYKHPLGPKSLRRYFGTVTSSFGWRDGRSHNGVDLELHLWDTVYNVFPGVVRMAKSYAGFGNVVVVRHYNGMETLYAHLSRFKVKTGDTIMAGIPVGLGGSTGNSTGTHLHLEMRFKGVPLNPAHIISFTERDLYADTIVIKKTNRSYIAYPHGASIHVVKRGEYVHRIARRYGIEIEKFCEMNGITRKTRLIVGQKLAIKE